MTSPSRRLDDSLAPAGGYAPEGEVEERVQHAVDSVLDEAGTAPPPAVRAPDGTALPAPLEQEERTPGWAEKLVRVLDDGIRIPGTDFRFGLDAIIGFLFPSAGDVITGAGSLSLLFLAVKERVPTVVIGRMVVNIAIDTIVGTVPLLGDAFDLFWKSNRKNLELIERYRDDPDAKPSAADYLLVGTGVLLVAASIALPLLFMWLVGAGVASLFE